MWRIGLDGTRLQVEKYGGPEVVARRLLPLLAKSLQRRGAKVYLFVCRPPREQWAGEIVLLRGKYLVSQWQLAYAAWRLKINRLICPAHMPPWLLMRRVAAFWHDISWEKIGWTYPWWQRCYLRWGAARVARAAPIIFTYTEKTRRELVRTFSVAPQKIFVVRPGDPTPSALPPRSSGKFLLYVGRIAWRKGLPTLWQALERLPAPPPLVCVGKEDCGGKQLKQWAQARKLPITFREWLSEKEKNHLARQALALVLPSWDEGYGLVIREAIWRWRLPVLAAKCGGVPEACQGYCTLLPPFEAKAWAEAIGQLQANIDSLPLAPPRPRRLRWNSMAEKVAEIVWGELERKSLAGLGS